MQNWHIASAHAHLTCACTQHQCWLHTTYVTHHFVAYVAARSCPLIPGTCLQTFELGQGTKSIVIMTTDEMLWLPWTTSMLNSIFLCLQRYPTVKEVHSVLHKELVMMV